MQKDFEPTYRFQVVVYVPAFLGATISTIRSVVPFLGTFALRS